MNKKKLKNTKNGGFFEFFKTIFYAVFIAIIFRSLLFEPSAERKKRQILLRDLDREFIPEDKYHGREKSIIRFDLNTSNKQGKRFVEGDQSPFTAKWFAIVYYKGSSDDNMYILYPDDDPLIERDIESILLAGVQASNIPKGPNSANNCYVSSKKVSSKYELVEKQRNLAKFSPMSSIIRVETV